MKIGEILIQRGLITKVQLKEALDAQLIFGGNAARLLDVPLGGRSWTLAAEQGTGAES